MPDAKAAIRARRRISFVWIVPIVTLVIGVWMVVYTLQSRGPEITIRFSSAEGIEPGKTKIKVLSLEVGLVESAVLSRGFDRVVVTARIEKEAAPLLREDTQFWVVRPRIGKGGVSGLGTLLSGGFIQLAPGEGPIGRRDFLGLDEPPITPAGTPGIQLELVSDRAGSIGSGDPILYQGFRVGRIESGRFDVSSQQTRYRAFVESPYDELVNSHTRFWNASGIALSATADGLEVRTGSLESILLGGVAMGLPESMAAGEPVGDGARFELYPDYRSVNERPYEKAIEYVVLFSQSVRGLRPGAPVEYRGLPAGRVERVLLEEFAADIRGEDDRIPVLIRLEPGPQGLPDTEDGVEQLARAVEIAVENGLRVSLETGNLLTGSLYVGLDVHPDAPPAEMGVFAGRPTIPTIGSGLAGIQTKLASLLDKLDALPVEETVASANRTLGELNALLSTPEAQGLPASLEATLVELRTALASLAPESELQDRTLAAVRELDLTLQAMRGLIAALEAQPNAVIFPRERPDDLEPARGAP